MDKICFIGEYDKTSLQTLLEEIENRFPEVVWSGGDKPSAWNPLAFNSKKKFYVAVEIRNGNLSYFIDRSKEVYEEDLRTYMKGYTLITFDDFINGNMQEIENKMDISFLYG
jgi:hypothetical protein